MVCGSNIEYQNHLQLYNIQSKEYIGETKIIDGCGYAAYLGDSSNLIISTSFKDGIGLTILDLLSGNLPFLLPQKEIYSAGYSTGMLADSSNQKNSTILQIAINNSSENSFSIYDEYKVGEGYIAQQTYGNILSLGVDDSNQQIAFELTPSGNSGNSRAILLLTYDNTSNNYL